MLLGEGENPKLKPLTDVVGGMVQEKQKAFLNEIIQKVNDLFEGDLTEYDKLVYVNNVIKGKLVESKP
jgi:type I restriction enzyme R subunit